MNRSVLAVVETGPAQWEFLEALLQLLQSLYPKLYPEPRCLSWLLLTPLPKHYWEGNTPRK